MSKLIGKFLFLILLAFSFTLIFDLMYRRFNQLVYPLPEALLPHPTIEEKYQIVKVGNSHAQDGVSFKGYKLKNLDLTRGAQRFKYDLVMLRQYSNQIEEGAIIIIDASQISFSHSDANVVDGVQHTYYKSASPLLIPHLKVGDYLQSEIFPFLRSGYLWRQAYAKTVQERIAQEQKAPSVKEEPAPVINLGETQPLSDNELRLTPENKYYNVEIIEKELASPSADIPETYRDNLNFIFNKWYHTDEFNPRYFETNRRDLEELIAYCLSQKWRPVVITIPIAQVLEEALLDDYLQVYLYDNINKTDLQGAPYLDYTSRRDITANFTLFGNADHLNPKGAAIFSYVLLQDLIDLGYVSPEVDGYDHRPLLQ